MASHDPPVPTSKRLRVGSVSYLNAKPLLWGVENDPRVDLSLAVPSKLIDGLADQSLDVALLPVIDYQRLPGLRVVAVGGIGCDGPTLTVRLFSTVPIEEITQLACDVDSHTSVALARVILAESYGLRPEFIDPSRQPAGDVRRSILLIGDKVVCEEPPNMPHQLDLGEAWKKLTGRPFVFAVWTARDGVDLDDLPDRLRAARIEGMRHIDEIVQRFALPEAGPPTWPGGT